MMLINNVWTYLFVFLRIVMTYADKISIELFYSSRLYFSVVSVHFLRNIYIYKTKNVRV